MLDKVKFEAFSPIEQPKDCTVLNDFRDMSIDVSHPLHKEQLVSISDYGISGYEYCYVADNTNPPYRTRLEGSQEQIYVRRSVADLLVMANEKLARYNCELHIWSGYKSLELQKGIWDYFIDDIRERYPNFNSAAIRREVSKKTSDPENFKSEDPHSWHDLCSGARLDVTLKDMQTGRFLKFGGFFNQEGEITRTDYLEKKKGHFAGDLAPMYNRRLLFNAMTSVGFTNNPQKYWQYNWGNQMYAASQNLHKPNVVPAWYGAAHDLMPIAEG